MNRRIVCLLIYMPVILLLTGCQPKDQPLIPVTGVEDSPVPALVELARGNVLQYVISTSRLANAPPSADWQLDHVDAVKGEYCFRSGDWLMAIWTADANEGKQRIVVFNKVENASWWGYVEPDGYVVDTAYAR